MKRSTNICPTLLDDKKIMPDTSVSPYRANVTEAFTLSWRRSLSCRNYMIGISVVKSYETEFYSFFVCGHYFIQWDLSQTAFLTCSFKTSLSLFCVLSFCQFCFKLDVIIVYIGTKCSVIWDFFDFKSF